jgi:predicted metalloenzyme YecM
MNDDLQNIIGDYHTFLKQILQEIVDEGFDLSDFSQMDHMCYRVPSLERYELKKQELAQVSKLLGEAQINGRPIAVFRLNKPIYYDNWRIDTVELPAPKEGVKVDEGLEHVELVLFDAKEEFLKKYAGKQFEMQSADRGINPEIGFRLPTYTVKFHLLSLPTVVYLEKKLRIVEVRDGQ